jgi:AraC-like DNA-binding protein
MNDSVVMVSNYPNVEDVVDFQDGLLIAGSSLLPPGKKKPMPRHDLPVPPCEDCQGMYLWQEGQLRKLNLPEFNYRQITKVADYYYLASDNGLVVWDGIKVITVITKADGLTNNRVSTMELDEDGFLWVSTFSGLNRIQPTTGKITQYLRNIEFNYLSVFQSDSLIYMGSMHGVYAFNPKHFIGDEIEPAPRWSIKKILLLSGLGMIILFSIAVYFVNRYYRRMANARSLKLKETEKKLFLLQIEQVVFRTDIAITVSNLADTLEMSERTLYRSFREYDLTPGAYLKELKLKKAMYLLNGDQGKHSLKEIAQKVGYTEQYLNRLLKDAD